MKSAATVCQLIVTGQSGALVLEPISWHFQDESRILSPDERPVFVNVSLMSIGLACLRFATVNAASKQTNSTGSAAGFTCQRRVLVKSAR